MCEIGVRLGTPPIKGPAMTEDEKQTVQRILSTLSEFDSEIGKIVLDAKPALASAYANPDFSSVVSTRFNAHLALVQSILPDGILGVDNSSQDQTPTGGSAPIPDHVQKETEMKGDVAPDEGPRDHSYAYDLLLLLAAKFGQGILEHPVGIKHIFELASTFDPRTQRAPMRSKLNRMKTDKGEIDWQNANKIFITPIGETRIGELREFVSPTEDKALKAAFVKAWKRAPQQY